MTLEWNQNLVEEATAMTYKEVPGASLTTYAFLPEDHQPGDQRTAVLFFAAGLWDHAVPGQFAPHCLHFRQRGAVSFLFEYRMLGKHRATPLDAVADAKSAFRWTRMNAEALGIDPSRIVGVGASGGGHLCLAAALVPGFDEPSESLEISASPNAMVLFGPIVDTSKKGMGLDRFPDPKSAKAASPMEHVRKGLPPTLILQGAEDRVVPLKLVEQFAKAMKRKRNVCELVTYAREGTSFFNFNVNMQHFESTLNYADRFLVDLGFLVPDAATSTNRLAS